MANATGPAVRLRQAPGVLERNLLDGVLVLAPAHPPALALAGSAAVLWRTLAVPRSEGELVAELRSAFDDPDGALADDVHRTLAQLVDHGLVCDTAP